MSEAELLHLKTADDLVELTRFGRHGNSARGHALSKCEEMSHLTLAMYGLHLAAGHVSTNGELLITGRI